MHYFPNKSKIQETIISIYIFLCKKTLTGINVIEYVSGSCGVQGPMSLLLMVIKTSDKPASTQ